jgi:hypothetical protein
MLSPSWFIAVTRHVADDDRRMARNVFGQMLLIDPRFGIGIAADPVIDQERQRLVLVELRQRRRGRQGQSGGKKNAQNHGHHFFSCFGSNRQDRHYSSRDCGSGLRLHASRYTSPQSRRTGSRAAAKMTGADRSRDLRSGTGQTARRS